MAVAAAMTAAAAVAATGSDAAACGKGGYGKLPTTTRAQALPARGIPPLASKVDAGPVLGVATPRGPGNPTRAAR